MADSRNIVESFREVVQDLLVPELKAVKISVEGLREEMGAGDTSLRDLKRACPGNRLFSGPWAPAGFLRD